MLRRKLMDVTYWRFASLSLNISPPVHGQPPSLEDAAVEFMDIMHGELYLMYRLVYIECWTKEILEGFGTHEILCLLPELVITIVLVDKNPLQRRMTLRIAMQGQRVCLFSRPSRGELERWLIRLSS
ncbi:hypothetical protein MLD38_033743 [Melastoma candidum]|uniref:Uncharacterized protein n=1 Tax=Melastoma candidum TaxID=119954 RepID=A0ACB9M7Q9_9MYRT|nr:hypothetical protein MLD38_033743 [Melastoma candidum]